MAVSTINAASMITGKTSRRGFWQIARLGCWIAAPGQKCTLNASDNALFCFPLKDTYWARLLAKDFAYEPELDYLFQTVRQGHLSFLDCGANFGFWSIIAASMPERFSSVISVEPSNYSSSWLMENIKLNKSNVTVLNRAISDTVGSIVTMSGDRQGHQGAHILQDEKHKDAQNQVETTTIDEITKNNPSQLRRWLVKLDVEGSEVAALSSARETIEAGSVIVFECHGKDKHSNVTRYAIEEMKMSVFYLDEGRKLHQIHSASEATKFKKRRKKGYNFIGAKSKDEIFTCFPDLTTSLT